MSIAFESRSGSEVIGEAEHSYLLTADQFLQIVEAGIFPREARVYLCDGRIVEKGARTNALSVLAGMIHEALFAGLPHGWKVMAEGEFKLDRTNAGLPDLAVIRTEDFRSLLQPGRFPQGSDIGLAVEVAVTSLAKDLGSNLRRYAEATIPTYWVADFTGQRIVVHTRPQVFGGRGSYEQVEIIEPGGSVGLVLDGQEVARFAYEDLMP